MKKAILLLALFTAILFSCRKSETRGVAEHSITGKWRLAETLADPGDGSGTWKPVAAATQTFITFTSDGNIEGNAFPQARHYNVLNETTIRFTFSDGTFILYNYTLTPTTLVLSGGGCIEACGAKFIKENTLHQ